MDKAFEDLLGKLDVYTKKHPHLKNSSKREYVLKALFFSDAHLSSDEIYKKVKSDYDPSIGIATIYRVLSFLEEGGFLKSITINGIKYYEIDNDKHHDHIICVRCGKVVEFCDESIEKKQSGIARKNGFKLVDHYMALYGVCAECQKEEKDGK